jgi:hypothetical protein
MTEWCTRCTNRGYIHIASTTWVQRFWDSILTVRRLRISTALITRCALFVRDSWQVPFGLLQV